MTRNDFTSIDVFCALDVGKSAHHGTALLADGRTVFDKPLPNGEPQLRELFPRLGRPGKVLVVVDQPASVGTLAVAWPAPADARWPTCPACPCADCHPGTGKTDARDAYVIADAARAMPHPLHSIEADESVRAELTMVYDDDLVQDATRTSNRLRVLLTSIIMLGGLGRRCRAVPAGISRTRSRVVRRFARAVSSAASRPSRFILLHGEDDLAVRGVRVGSASGAACRDTVLRSGRARRPIHDVDAELVVVSDVVR
ncbi:IS110 family transposase [Streptomyces sp. NPDC060000]|uniref:IS110 family transposase n=1 Tax=Streptomyces sp. NPDC060000 TaxID=3347031 RepID=UPI0036AE5691